LKEADIILQLEELYREKHGKDATEEEKEQWRTSLRETVAAAKAATDDDNDA
jgi:hypothetical protein